MKKIMKKILLLSAIVISSLNAFADEGGELLWWMISDIESISGKDKDGNVFYATELGVEKARVRYENQSGEYGYLPLWGLDENNEFFQESNPASGVILPAEYYGSLAGLAENSASYSFVIELGNWTDGRWTGMMESESVSYRDLVADNHITNWDNLAPVDSTYWAPSSYHVVPEPNSSILVLLGGALFALRRRNNKKAA